MNAFASYLRHLIVTAILLAVEKLKLPIEGADAAADAIALAVVGTLSWWFVKYLVPKIKVPKGSGLALFALAASLALLTPSCTVSIGPDGNATVSPDPETIEAVSNRVAEEVNERLRARKEEVEIVPTK
jgi:hypothetical protein